MLVTLLAKLGNLSRSGVRFLEDRGVLKPRYSEGGYRVFSYDDFMRLRLFQNLRGMGLTQKESLEAAALEPGGRREALANARRREVAEHKRRLRLIDTELGRIERAEGGFAPEVVMRPAFVALPDCSTYLDSDGAAERRRGDEVAREGIRWWSKEESSFGLVFLRNEAGEVKMGRYALIEAASACPPSLGPGAVFCPSRRCLRVAVVKRERDEGTGLPCEARAAAEALGVAVTMDGAIARETYLRFEGEDLCVHCEMWLPLQ